MKTISVENVGFNLCDDPVRTEEVINERILKELNGISDDYVYFSFPLAWGINEYGIGQIQQLIHQVNGGVKEKIVYVCQHIQVKNLDFGQNIVFTPHATVDDDYHAIPHYSANRVDHPSNFGQRKYLMSFMGSFMTHPTRMFLHKVLSQRSDCLVENTGNWHFYKNENEKSDFSDVYNNAMNDTKVALCPRGTGPSTIRMWECMAAGCIPLVISDRLKMPMEDVVEWEKAIIRVPEKDIQKIMDYIPDDEILEEMSKNVLDIYGKYFCNSQLHQTTIKTLEKL
tara:strand:+ start:2092 stop:2940 length:849 start_codon:yes stop_codon:yes gene_type:complete